MLGLTGKGQDGEAIKSLLSKALAQKWHTSLPLIFLGVRDDFPSFWPEQLEEGLAIYGDRKDCQKSKFENMGADSEFSFEHVEFEMPTGDTQAEICLRQLEM